MLIGYLWITHVMAAIGEQASGSTCCSVQMLTHWDSEDEVRRTVGSVGLLHWYCRTNICPRPVCVCCESRWVSRVFWECWAVKQLSETMSLTKMDEMASQCAVHYPGYTLPLSMKRQHIHTHTRIHTYAAIVSSSFHPSYIQCKTLLHALKMQCVSEGSSEAPLCRCIAELATRKNGCSEIS